MISYRYKLEETLNSLVNFESLDIEIQTSPVTGYQKVHSVVDEIQVDFKNPLSEEHKTYLDSIIQTHTGEPARTTTQLQVSREFLFSQIVNMAHIHPVLKVEDTVNPIPETGPNVITNYLTYIDNYINAWKRDGNHEILVNKLISDASDQTEHTGFLNKVITLEGHRTFEFLISQIPTTPYI